MSVYGEKGLAKILDRLAFLFFSGSTRSMVK